VWVGDVLIRASAEGTDTYELNRNLVLTDGARADSVPNLEIETGEIEGAGHASRPAASTTSSCSTCGTWDPRGRGRRLVVRGFFAERRRPDRRPRGRGAPHAAVERELGSARCTHERS
jgi:Fe-S cluster assembly protein SufD